MPQDIWDNFNKNKAEKQVLTIFKQMKTLKTKVNSTSRELPLGTLPPKDSLEEEDLPNKNKKDVNEITSNLKTLLFTMVWL